MTNLKILIGVFAVLLCVTPLNKRVIAEAPVMQIKAEEITAVPEDTKEAIAHFAELYEAPLNELTITIKCESEFNNSAVGDGGRAKTLAQYHEPTFIGYAKKFEKETGRKLEYGNRNDAIELMAWQWVKYPKSKWEWTTWAHWFGRGEGKCR